MTVHDWSKVESGIFHHFHHSWIEELQRVLNAGLLPSDYYAMAEQQTTGFGPDVLTLQDAPNDSLDPIDNSDSSNGGSLLLAAPEVALTAESDLEFYRRKQNAVAIRHITGDRIVSVIEVVSRGNKASNVALRSFVEKAAEFLLQGIHLLVIDLHLPGNRDPNGIHAVIWEELTGQISVKPPKPLTLAAYESGPQGVRTRAYVQPVDIGDALPDMPLFLKFGGHVPVPLEMTYSRAFDAVPTRWRRVLQSSNNNL